MASSSIAAALLLFVSAVRSALLLRTGRGGESVLRRLYAALIASGILGAVAVGFAQLDLPPYADYCLILAGHALLLAASVELTASPAAERFMPLLSFIPAPAAVAGLISTGGLLNLPIWIVCAFTLVCFAANTLVDRFTDDGDLCVRIAQRIDLVCVAAASVLMLKASAVANSAFFGITVLLILVTALWWSAVKSDFK